MMIRIVTAILLIHSGLNWKSNDKSQEDLSILSMMPLTGKEPARGLACRTAMEIVQDKVNSNSAILPDYHVTLDVQDEARNANNAPSVLINYMRPYLDNPNEKPSRFLSPIVLGPSITCQYGPYLVRRDILPNLYRIQMPGEFSVVAITLFIKEVGAWGQIAIFTYSLNINEYTMAKKLNQLATDNGVEVLHYHNEAFISLESVSLAKQSGARIFALIYLQVAMCVRFLCYSYMLDMRSPYYVFLPQIFCYFTVDSADLVLPEGCSAQMIYEQMKTTYWTGVAPVNDGWLPNVTTTLGYNLDWFDREMNARLNTVIPADIDQKHLCHDTVLAALVTLDKAEIALRRDYNRSLKDFQKNPKLVYDVINESAANLDFMGIRIGRIKYSKKREIAKENIWVMQWTNGGLKRLFQIPWEEREEMYNLSVYSIIVKESPNWRTKTGNPPKDLSYIEHRIKHFGLIEIIILLVIAGAGACAKVAILLVDFKAIRNSFKLKKRYRYVVDTQVFFGCVMLDAGAAYLLGGGYVFEISPNLFYCNFLSVLPIIGLSVLTAVILTRTALTKQIGTVSHFVKTGIPKIFSQRKLSRIRSLPNNTVLSNKPTTALFNRMVNSEWNSIDKKTTWVSGGVVFVVLIFCQALVTTNMNTFQIRKDTGSIFVNEYDDTFFDETIFFCYSQAYKFIFTAIFSIIWIAILVSCFMAYKIGKSQIRDEFLIESVSAKIASFNAATVMAGSILIGIAFESQFHLLVVAIASSLLVFSNSTTFIWFRNVLKKKPQTVKKEPTIQNSPSRTHVQGRPQLISSET